MRSLSLSVALTASACALSHEQEPIVEPTDPCIEAPADRTPLELGDVRSASFVGSALHLVAEIDGQLRYGVFEVAGSDLRLMAFVDLDGPASWVRMSETRAVRVLDSERGLVVEVLDDAVAETPYVVDRLELPGSAPPGWQGFFGATADRLYVCVATDEPGRWRPGTLLVVALPSLVLVSESESRACGRERGRIDGDVVMTWTADGDAWVDRLGDGGSTPVVDYLYNPDGIHQYGSVLHAATDGDLAVMDPDNPREFFVFDLRDDAPLFAHAYFEHSQTLLAVRDARAYFASAAGLRSHALDPAGWSTYEWQSPPVTDWRAIGAIDAGAARMLADSGTELVVAEGDARLFVVDTAATAPLTEASLYRGGAAAGCSADREP